jgi:TolA-binding protein
MIYAKMRQRVLNFGVSLVLYSFLLFGVSGCDKSCEDLYKRAMALYQGGKYQKAVQIFELILTKYPEHSLTRQAHYQLGNIYFYKLGQPQMALKHLQALYAQSPQGKYAMKALELIGYIYDKSLNRCLDGIEAYRKLIQDYSAEIEAEKYQLAIADCYFRLSDYDQAISEYEVLVKQYPASEYVARAKFQIANSYALQEVYDKAIELYKALIPLNTISDQLVVDAKLELAYCYKQKEQFTNALALYEELLKNDSQNVSIDKEVITRKKELILKLIAANSREPGEVDWKRRKQ